MVVLRRAVILVSMIMGTAVQAQSMNQPQVVGRLVDVIQFGVPRDSNFIVCEGEDCPHRSIKHLYIEPAAQVARPVEPQPVVIPPSVQITPELSPAKVEQLAPAAPPKSKIMKRKRRIAKAECKPS